MEWQVDATGKRQCGDYTISLTKRGVKNYGRYFSYYKGVEITGFPHVFLDGALLECAEHRVKELTNHLQQISSEKRSDFMLRHVKRGSKYLIVGKGLIQSDTHLTDYSEVVIYQGQDNRYWVRPVSEFYDGRFEEIPTEEI
jgi:hypothetical protein